MSERFYSLASDILFQIRNKKGTVRSLCLSDKIEASMKKRMVAIVTQTLQYEKVLEEIMEKSGILKTEKRLKPTMALVMIYDLLFGKGIHCKGSCRDSVMKHKARLHSELVKIKVKRKISKNEDLTIIPVSFSLNRYVRVNTLKITWDEAIKQLSNYKEDCHIGNLLSFPPNTNFYDNGLYKNGSLILQDKASCFPAFILNPPLDSYCIDACAAPGNKTSHLSQMLQNTGQIFAFDLDAKRLETLKSLVGKAGCTNIEAICLDFLKVDYQNVKYSQVEYFIVDPSCSGSGMVDRYTEGEKEEMDADRLSNLAKFQQSVIEHAMKFPKAKRIVYSTCSVHEEENEQVVTKVLENNSDFELVDILPTWERRGLSSYPHRKLISENR